MLRAADALLDELQGQIHYVHPELWFEVGGHPRGPRELVVTAEGKVEIFPWVQDLVRAAPRIPGWEIIAFKQPQGFEFTIEY